jgi:hypothetical protein
MREVLPLVVAWQASGGRLKNRSSDWSEKEVGFSRCSGSESGKTGLSGSLSFQASGLVILQAQLT